MSHGTLDRTSGLTTVSRHRGTYFRVMGHTVKGALTLYLEEAAWLINMNVLRVPEAGLEDYFGLMFTRTDHWITYEKYQVYAYLRRLGYIVQRSTTTTFSTPVATSLGSSSLSFSFWARRCQGLIHTAIHFIKRILIYCFGTKPLVRNKQYSTFESVYSALKFIPSSPWYKPFSIQEQTPLFDWDIYRPNPQWKKRDPGVPDFRVVVTSSRGAIPSLAKYQQIFGDLEHRSLSSSSYHQIRYTNTFNLSFLLAVVDDTGSVSFLRICGDGVVDIKSSVKN
ncbi:hypothetical protein BDA99DRAFT_159910 [Phascolomyces articulosus]|uniref:tRNA-splicing endonuclease subunit Sen54 N-terminal domain-containing protein n=1 Tax=Phascolomyces articulosus TaxID=60185 RepID=A0AAD5K3R4_9FUNG|nr:hypothetical protein BDA99DRAFT_159910 [Phascolomyces articulosus]